MVETREQLAIKTKRLNSIVDDIFDVYESVHEMFRSWKRDYHTVFIEQLMRLQKLETELYALGYDEYFVCILKQTVYRSVFASR